MICKLLRAFAAYWEISTSAGGNFCNEEFPAPMMPCDTTPHDVESHERTLRSKFPATCRLTRFGKRRVKTLVKRTNAFALVCNLRGAMQYRTPSLQSQKLIRSGTDNNIRTVISRVCRVAFLHRIVFLLCVRFCPSLRKHRFNSGTQCLWQSIRKSRASR